MYNIDEINTLELNKKHPLNFVGTAVHGGGSCQVSITYDAEPNENSVWKVIYSIEGGCPAKNAVGNLGDDASKPVPDGYEFLVPAELPTGRATLAWTWFNKIGNREMYMNCAPVDIVGANAKRTVEEDDLVANLTQVIERRDQSFYNSLPDMFTANIGKGCATIEGTDVVFPNPGERLDLFGQQTKAALGPPVGTACGAVVAAPTKPPVATSAVPPVVTSVAPEPEVSLPGGVFITQPPATTAPPATTLVPVVSSPPVNPGQSEPAAPVVSQAPVSSAAPSPVQPAPVQSSAPAVPVVGGSSTITPGTACPGQEGMWNCINGNSFQRCASGQWSVVQSVAAGTQCETGLSEYIKIGFATSKKREVRFANPHVRRHIGSSR
jgi:hypothetical protein